MYEAKQHKAAVSHKFSVTEKKSVQQLRMNDNRERSVPQKKRVQGNQSISALQFIKKCDLHNDMGQEFKAKHIAEGSVLPSMRTEENNANILEAIYYHRDKKDRKPKHTMLFCTSTVLCENLLSTINDAEDVSYGKQYISTNEYPAITILRSYNEHDDKYSRAEFEYGNAKVKVMVKKEGNRPCFDHLVGTEPQSLPNKINLIG